MALGAPGEHRGAADGSERNRSVITFTSSTLVPVATMPTALRWFADVNPIKSVADATRDLMLGNPAASSVLSAICAAPTSSSDRAGGSK